MMTPALFGENLLDDFFGFPFRRNFVSPFFAESDKLTGNLMQTDVCCSLCSVCNITHELALVNREC